MTAAIPLAPLLERFFTQRLMQERQVSTHTICSYRDTFRLFLTFAQQRLHKPPSALVFETIDAPLIVAFLDHLEKQRGLSVRSRNLRLTRDSFVLSLHRFRVAHAFGTDPARARYSQQAFHPHPGSLPDACRSRCLARCPRSTYLVRTARPCLHPDGGADRFAGIRDYRRYM